MSDETTNKYIRDDLGLMFGILDKLKDYRCMLIAFGERERRYVQVLTEIINDLDGRRDTARSIAKVQMADKFGLSISDINEIIEWGMWQQ